MNNNDKKFSFQVEGQSFELPHEKVPAKIIIEMAQEKGIASALNQPIESLTLKSDNNKIYSWKDEVNLSLDNHFSLGVKKYTFEVNGQKLETSSEKLMASDIIEMAKKKGVTPGNKSENLLLEAIGEKGQTFKNDEWVNLMSFVNL